MTMAGAQDEQPRSGVSGASAPSRRRSRRRYRRWLIPPLAVLVLLVLYVGGTFVQVARASSNDDARPVGAIVVLGAAQYDGRPSPVLRNRLDHALDLYDADYAEVIVVTGGRQEGDRFTEATTGYSYLRAQGIPDAAILREVQGRTTYESVAAVSRFLADEGIDSVILISGKAQSKRLAGIADDLDLDAAISPAGINPGRASLARETVAVAVGRIIGYRRLDRLDR